MICRRRQRPQALAEKRSYSCDVSKRLKKGFVEVKGSFVEATTFRNFQWWTSKWDRRKVLTRLT